MFYGVRRADSNAGNKRNADELEASWVVVKEVLEKFLLIKNFIIYRKLFWISYDQEHLMSTESKLSWKRAWY
jgi:hypothetical protein